MGRPGAAIRLHLSRLVVRALNADTPFDQFVPGAACRRSHGAQGEPWRLSALGILRSGGNLQQNIHDSSTIRSIPSCAAFWESPWRVPAATTINTIDFDGRLLFSVCVFASSEAPQELRLVAAEGDCWRRDFEKQVRPKARRTAEVPR